MSALSWALNTHAGVHACRPAADAMTSTAAAGNSQDKIVACNGGDDVVPVMTQPTTRGGLRVYKIVVLGDGGVGKSGIYIYIYICAIELIKAFSSHSVTTLAFQLLRCSLSVTGS